MGGVRPTHHVPKHRICVVSGRYPPSIFASQVNHHVYCESHGYTYINCSWPTSQKNRYLNKIEYIRRYYHLFDYLFWIDDDAFFMNLEIGLEHFLPGPGEFLSICRSPNYKKLHTFISSGQFMLACSDTGRAFIDAVACVDLDLVEAWWTPELGYFSRGDQDCMVYLLKTDKRFAGFSRHGHGAFNSRVEDLEAEESVFVLHFTGTQPIKQKNYHRVQKQLGRGPSLLPPSLEKSMNLELSGPSRIRWLMDQLRFIVR